MKQNKCESELHECLEKINELLSEYNCKIEFDKEIDDVIISDSDTNKFLHVDE